MADFKVRCIDPRSSDCFKLGDTSKFNGGVLYTPNGTAYTGKLSEINSVEVLNRHVIPQFELVPELPRICYILGGEDNPLKIGEEFDVSGTGTGFHVNEDGYIKWGGDTVDGWIVCEAINHPEKIIRRLQFSEDETEKLKAMFLLGLRFISRDIDGELVAYTNKPNKRNTVWVTNDSGWLSLCNANFTQVQWSDSEPFSIEKALEGLK